MAKNAFPLKNNDHIYGISLITNQLEVWIRLTGLHKLIIDNTKIDLSKCALDMLGTKEQNRHRITLPDGTHLNVAQTRRGRNTTIIAEFEDSKYDSWRADDKPHHMTFNLRDGKIISTVESWAKPSDRFAANDQGVVERTIINGKVVGEKVLHGERGEYHVTRTFGTKWGFQAAKEVWKINNGPNLFDATLPKWRAKRYYCTTSELRARIINHTRLRHRSGMHAPVLDAALKPVTTTITRQGRTKTFTSTAPVYSAQVPVRFDARTHRENQSLRRVFLPKNKL